MNYLGIDYGRAKIGLSFADGPLAEPLKVLRIENLSRKAGSRSAGELGIEELLTVIRDLQIGQIVIGVSEGAMEKEIREFGAKLEKTLSETVIPAKAGIQPIIVHYHDETLSTKEAQRLAIESGKKQKKRRDMEDSYAATLVLQNYLDTL